MDKHPNVTDSNGEVSWTLDAQYVDALKRGELVEVTVEAGGHTMRYTLWMDSTGDIRTDAQTSRP